MNFKFKGTRNYVHGTDIYNAIANFATEQLALVELKDIHYTLHKVMRKNLSIEVFKNERVPKRKNTAIVFLCRSENDYYQFMLQENDQDVKGSYEYDENAIVEDCKYDPDKKTLELTDAKTYTDIELIVALNKRLLNLVFPEGPGKWFFTQLKINEYIKKSNYRNITLKFIKNLNFKLTKSQITIDGKEIGHIFFSSAR